MSVSPYWLVVYTSKWGGLSVSWEILRLMCADIIVLCHVEFGFCHTGIKHLTFKYEWIYSFMCLRIKVFALTKLKHWLSTRSLWQSTHDSVLPNYYILERVNSIKCILLYLSVLPFVLTMPICDCAIYYFSIILFCVLYNWFFVYIYLMIKHYDWHVSNIIKTIKST